MGICVNPYCEEFCKVAAPVTEDICSACESSLLLQGRYELDRLLKPFQVSPHVKIFAALDREQEKSVVIKLSDLPQGQGRDMLEREHQFLMQMPEPFPQIQLDDLFEWQPHPDLPIVVHCLVLPYLKGLDSDGYIARNGKITIDRAILWFRQLLDFVALIHDQGYLHRDIKPSNIIISPGDQLTLIDFGTTRKMDSDYLRAVGSTLTSSQGKLVSLTRIISHGYSASEQIDGRGVPQSDFYSMARTFVYWVTGLLPNELPSAESGLLQWQSYLPREYRALRQFMDSMMDVRVEKRPQNVAIIEYFLDETWPRLQRRQHRNISTPLMFFGVLALLICVPLAIEGMKWGLSRFFFYRGSEQMFNGQLLASKATLKRSLEFDSQFGSAHHNLASICQDIGDSDCAIEHYQKALELVPENWQSHYNLGGIWEDLGLLDKAELEYQRAIAQSGASTALPFNNLARLKILNQDYEQAIALLIKAKEIVQSEPDLAIIHKNLGWAYWAQNKFPEAKTQLSRARDLSPQVADAYCLLAKLYEDLQQRQEAKNNWVACLSLNSESKDVLQWRTEAISRTID